MLRRWQIPLLVIVFGALSAGQVWLSHLRVGVAQQVSSAAQAQRLAQQDVQNLKLELASLMRPNTLRRLAHDELGMQAPTSMQVIRP
ncbi:MAG: cell division protein FtsL [Ghiorsea sp.]|nr:cell division protein FtsL [Ghiorsea sp.]